MTKKSTQADAEEELYAQAAGAIGVLCIAAGILAAIKDKLGLSWGGAVAVAIGALVALGYAAWWIRTRIHAYLHRKTQPAVRQDGPAGDVTAAQGDVPGPPVHAGLTTALSRAGAIGKEEVVLDEDVTVKQLDVGTLYKFLLPPSRTSEDVGKHLGPIASMFGVTRLHLKMETSRKSERQVRLLVLKEPPFSRPFPAPTRQEIADFAGVPMGHDVTGKLVGVPTFDKASLLVGGMTQTGKTTLVNGIITCLLIAYGDFDLYLLDGKLCGLTEFQKVAVRYEASDDPAVLGSMLDELNARVDDRYTKMQEAKRNRQPAPVFKPVFFIIDEAADFYVDNGSKDSQETVRQNEDKSRKLVSKSLESGISTIMMTQRPSNDAIPVKVRDQFLYRLCLYVAAKGTAKVALGDSYFETVAPIHPALLDPKIPGQAVLFAGGSSALIRGFWFADEFIWRTVDEVLAKQHSVISEVPETPLTRALRIMEEKGVEFIPTADLAPLLDVTDTSPSVQGKRLSKLLGVPPGKDEKGVVRGYWVNDLSAAAKASR
ncbi:MULTISPECIES: FtsK/SpoIIIE domain-containing protein [Streptomyces]|uniref:FtsK/SpoIIIE domain-containing protein n=1 Tax=Streptomyces glycanivorans TaxID=3033808 RepID=A0ABY9JNK5_9ACTN|nr:MULTISPECIES: FtsK/SpoIIIE domain-containing protein [unclassified Streptomyces]WLQ69188.1 FtsK/SpoIIIE domain-containing protein [Streptomyces sp. Alt3]WSR53536.1 FtsK/SpoIIIE domain-containing protein [Streptomyces sp. NBC_01201]